MMEHRIDLPLELTLDKVQKATGGIRCIPFIPPFSLGQHVRLKDQHVVAKGNRWHGVHIFRARNYVSSLEQPSASSKDFPANLRRA
jgi:hypothetical protein